MSVLRVVRRRASLIAAAATTTILALAGIALVATLSEGASGRTRLPATRFDGATLPAGVRAAPFSLRDQNGQRTTLAQYRGQVVILSFMYSHCHDTCPLMATEIRGALAELGRRARRVPVLAISVDPAHDTPASARKFISREGLSGRMRFLLGSQRQLAPVWKGYAIQPESTAHGRRYAGGHSSFVFLIDRRGYEQVGYPAGQLVPEDLAHDIRVLLAQPDSVTRRH